MLLDYKSVSKILKTGWLEISFSLIWTRQRSYSLPPPHIIPLPRISIIFQLHTKNLNVISDGNLRGQAGNRQVNSVVRSQMYKSHHGLTATYISELFNPYSTLRSSHCGILDVHHTWRKKTRDRANSAVAPWLWNSLLEDIGWTESLDTVKMHIRSHFYSLDSNYVSPDFIFM